jgi:integrase/recombinase XerD
MSTPPALLPTPASQQSIDAFIDALWLEDGLSGNTLAAYRRDLSLFAAWLAGQGLSLDQSREAQLRDYFAARHEASRATSANRRLSVLRRYFHWALREQRTQADPTLRLQAARQPPRVPKTLSEAQVEACWPRPTPPRRWACATAPCWS